MRLTSETIGSELNNLPENYLPQFMPFLAGIPFAGSLALLPPVGLAPQDFGNPRLLSQALADANDGPYYFVPGTEGLDYSLTARAGAFPRPLILIADNRFRVLEPGFSRIARQPNLRCVISGLQLTTDLHRK